MPALVDNTKGSPLLRHVKGWLRLITQSNAHGASGLQRLHSTPIGVHAAQDAAKKVAFSHAPTSLADRLRKTKKKSQWDSLLF